MKLNSLLIGDTVYELSRAYREGALALRNGVSIRCNPYRSADRQEHHDWDAGHCNEDGREHVRFGVDLIAAKKNGRVFEEDPGVPRDGNYINRDWYRNQLALA